MPDADNRGAIEENQPKPSWVFVGRRDRGKAWAYYPTPGLRDTLTWCGLGSRPHLRRVERLERTSPTNAKQRRHARRVAAAKERRING